MKIGDIYVAYVPYKEEQGGKFRPVLLFVLIGEGSLVISLKITSKPREQNRVKLKSWKQAGLKVPSYVQCDDYLVFRNPNEAKYVGTISDEDYKNITDKFNELNK